MKLHNVVLMTVLAFVCTLTLSGQGMYSSASMAGDETPDMTAMKPTFETTVVGVHMKVWIMTQMEHQKMMEMQPKDSAAADDHAKHEGMEMEKMTVDPMMSGTHHIKLEVSDATTGKMITSGTASVQIMSPSMKNSTVDLTAKMDHFGGGLTLDEKGEYKFILTVIADGAPKTAQFNYTVQ
jgi:hypothetical protein